MVTCHRANSYELYHVGAQGFVQVLLFAPNRQHQSISMVCEHRLPAFVIAIFIQSLPADGGISITVQPSSPTATDVSLSGTCDLPTDDNFVNGPDDSIQGLFGNLLRMHNTVGPNTDGVSLSHDLSNPPTFFNGPDFNIPSPGWFSIFAIDLPAQGSAEIFCVGDHLSFNENITIPIDPSVWVRGTWQWGSPGGAIANGVTLTVVPESSPFLGMGLVGLGLIGIKKWKHRNPQ